MKTLTVTIDTLSNLYIGGMPKAFEIGGIDMQTVTQGGQPYIPASSFKGGLRDICKDYPNKEIEEIYKDYNIPPQIKCETAKHLFIFGIQGVNRSPKILLTDFSLITDTKDYFSIDSKNSIEEKSGTLISNPRTYQVARSGLSFRGELILNFDSLSKNEEEIERIETIVKGYIQEMCAKFSKGVYRIGNSKSRGYGHITVKVSE